MKMTDKEQSADADQPYPNNIESETDGHYRHIDVPENTSVTIHNRQ
jgi:hypothetical protein